uniref:UDP-glycosyltransferase 3 n=1 Tax=Litchi chinensis TaxID=151069 RepID=W8FRI3_LITCN|nr:UDP-glycosyltransferase 3 [Litchi chinensis]
MAVTQSSLQKHVAVLAFPFGSHGLTIFKLMHRLASASPNLHFSFFSTKKSNDSLFSAADIPHNIKPYDLDDGVPTNHVSTQHPLETVELFLKTTPENYKRRLEMAVAETGRHISCLMTDAFLTFAGEMAETLDVAWIPVFVAMPYNVSAHFYTEQIRQLLINGLEEESMVRIENQTLEIIPGLSMMKISDLSDEILMGDSGDSLFSLMLSKLGSVLPKASTVVMNFYQQLYSTDLLKDLKFKLPGLLNVGFLTSQLPESDADSTGCLAWLDRREPKSVVYIGFGTVVTLPQHELVALAEALEESGVPFLWSLRDDKVKELPGDFLERNRGNGKIVARAPQTQVLGHVSVGVFVTHCGANSVFESVANGVPMICRPFFGDHRMNGRVVEEVWGIGVKVEGLVFTKNGVVKSLELVFGHEKGKKMRENVRLLQETVMDAAGPGGSATRDFNILVEKISRF